MLHYENMDRKKYNQFRVIVSLFVAAVVGLAVVNDSYLLSVAGVLTGMLFMIGVRVKAKIKVDEREATVQEKAARMTYAIFAPTIGISALLMLMPSRSGIAVFAKGEFGYLDSVGMILAYLALFLIAVYAISYRFFNQEYGGGDEE